MKSKFYTNIHKWFAGFIKFVLRVSVHGQENEPSPEQGSYIIVSNHISNCDPVLLCVATNKQQPRFMAKKELFKVPLLKQLIVALGAFPVDRKKTDVKSIKNTIKMLGEGYCVGMFPQGHRHKKISPRDTEVKSGAAMMAVKSQSMVLPCYIKTKNNKLCIFRKIDIIIGKPIKFEELCYDEQAGGEYARISKFIFEKVCELGD